MACTWTEPKPCVTPYAPRLATLEIGLAGCHGALADGASVSIPDRRLSAYYGDVIEGGWVIDKAGPLDRKPGLAVMAPLCRGHLPQGTRDPFEGAADSCVAHALAQEPENGYCGLARLMLAAPDCGAFDEVAPDVFAAWWREHGARIGRRHGNAIHWEDGTVEDIRPAELRWDCER